MIGLNLKMSFVIREIDCGYLNLGVTYNLMSPNKNSNLTIRLYDIGYSNAEIYRKEIIQKLAKSWVYS